MKTAVSLVAILIAATLPSIGSAQIYQWKDKDGQTIISDTPPPRSAKGTRTLGTAPPPSVEPKEDAAKGDAAGAKPGAAAPKTTAEKDLEFKKRQQETKEKADKDAKEQAAANERKANCERARNQLAGLEAGAQVASFDEKGGRHVLNNEARQQEVERTRKIVADSCSGQ